MHSFSVECQEKNLGGTICDHERVREMGVRVSGAKALDWGSVDGGFGGG
jgi:hypothetical protein